MAKRYSMAGTKYIGGGDDAPVSFKQDDTKKLTAFTGGELFTLEKHAKTEEGFDQTGWYLYGGGFAGAWCDSDAVAAVVAANTLVMFVVEGGTRQQPTVAAAPVVAAVPPPRVEAEPETVQAPPVVVAAPAPVVEPVAVPAPRPVPPKRIVQPVKKPVTVPVKAVDRPVRVPEPLTFAAPKLPDVPPDADGKYRFRCGHRMMLQPDKAAYSWYPFGGDPAMQPCPNCAADDRERRLSVTFEEMACGYRDERLLRMMTLHSSELPHWLVKTPQRSFTIVGITSDPGELAARIAAPLRKLVPYARRCGVSQRELYRQFVEFIGLEVVAGPFSGRAAGQMIDSRERDNGRAYVFKRARKFEAVFMKANKPSKFATRYRCGHKLTAHGIKLIGPDGMAETACMACRRRTQRSLDDRVLDEIACGYGDVEQLKDLTTKPQWVVKAGSHQTIVVTHDYNPVLLAAKLILNTMKGVKAVEDGWDLMGLTQTVMRLAKFRIAAGPFSYTQLNTYKPKVSAEFERTLMTALYQAVQTRVTADGRFPDPIEQKDPIRACRMRKEFASAGHAQGFARQQHDKYGFGWIDTIQCPVCDQWHNVKPLDFNEGKLTNLQLRGLRRAIWTEQEITTCKRKLYFATWSDARRKAMELQESYGFSNMDAYQCLICHRWHNATPIAVKKAAEAEAAKAETAGE